MKQGDFFYNSGTVLYHKLNSWAEFKKYLIIFSDKPKYLLNTVVVVVVVVIVDGGCVSAPFEKIINTFFKRKTTVSPRFGVELSVFNGPPKVHCHRTYDVARFVGRDLPATMTQRVTHEHAQKHKRGERKKGTVINEQSRRGLNIIYILSEDVLTKEVR